MEIKLLGSGCAKCKKLYDNAIKAVAESGVSAEVIKIEDINEIVEYGIMMTPGLVIDEQVKSVGKVLKPEAIAVLLK